MNKIETLEAANRLYPIEYTGRMFMPSRDELNNSYKQEAFIEGAKWMEDRMYSEKEVRKMLSESFNATIEGYNITADEIIEQSKKQ